MAESRSFTGGDRVRMGRHTVQDKPASRKAGSALRVVQKRQRELDIAKLELKNAEVALATAEEGTAARSAARNRVRKAQEQVTAITQQVSQTMSQRSGALSELLEAESQARVGDAEFDAQSELTAGFFSAAQNYEAYREALNQAFGADKGPMGEKVRAMAELTPQTVLTTAQAAGDNITSLWEAIVPFNSSISEIQAQIEAFGDPDQYKTLLQLGEKAGSAFGDVSGSPAVKKIMAKNRLIERERDFFGGDEAGAAPGQLAERSPALTSLNTDFGTGEAIRAAADQGLTFTNRGPQPTDGTERISALDERTGELTNLFDGGTAGTGGEIQGPPAPSAASGLAPQAGAAPVSTSNPRAAEGPQFGGAQLTAADQTRALTSLNDLFRSAGNSMAAGAPDLSGPATGDFSGPSGQLVQDASRRISGAARDFGSAAGGRIEQFAQAAGPAASGLAARVSGAIPDVDLSGAREAAGTIFRGDPNFPPLVDDPRSAFDTIMSGPPGDEDPLSPAGTQMLLNSSPRDEYEMRVAEAIRALRISEREGLALIARNRFAR